MVDEEKEPTELLVSTDEVADPRELVEWIKELVKSTEEPLFDDEVAIVIRELVDFVDQLI